MGNTTIFNCYKCSNFYECKLSYDTPNMNILIITWSIDPVQGIIANEMLIPLRMILLEGLKTYMQIDWNH